MNYEIGSTATYREILITALGAIPRPIYPTIPPVGLQLMQRFPTISFSEYSTDGTGWRAFGRIKETVDSWDFIDPIVDNLFVILDRVGYQIESREAIKQALLMGEKVYLFVRRNLVLREMIVLYPVPLNEIMFSEPNVVARASKLYPYCGLEF